jgi:hypothetical protein
VGQSHRSRLFLRTPLLLLCAGAVIIWLHAPPRRFVQGESVIPDSRVVRVLAKSHLSLVADLYWIRMASLAVAANTPAEGRQLLLWGEFVSDLDPGQKWVYMLGGLLGSMKINNTLYNGPEAEALLTKGVRNVPSEIRLYLYLSAVQIDLRHNADAARTLQSALTVPHCPSYVGPLAARLLTVAGEFDAAREFAFRLSQSDDPMERERFQQRVLEIDRERLLKRVDDAAAQFSRQFGRVPLALSELVAQGLLSEPPVDPLGGTIFLDEQGRAQVSSGKRLTVHRGVGEPLPELP